MDNFVNFSTTFNQLINNKLENFSIGVSAPVGNVYSNWGSPTSNTSTINKSMTFQPDLYYRQLKDYYFIKTILNILKAPIVESIDQINGQIKVSTIKDKDPLYKDAVIIVNNFFEKCNFKDFLKRHLDDMILRGAFLGYIDYKNNRILEVVNPFNFTLIHNGEEFSWVIPRDPVYSPADKNFSINAENLVNNLGNFYNTKDNIKGLRGNKLVKYYYDLEIIHKEPRISLINIENSFENKKAILEMLGKDVSIKTSQKLSDLEKRKLDEIIVAYTVYRPKSIFEPHLKSLFTLSIKEMVFDMLSLLQYLKSDYFTVATRQGVSDTTKPLKILNDIKSALNKYNEEFFKTFEDPSGIIKIVYDKLLNRNEILPISDGFNDISILNIPDLDQRLATLFQDIVETKRAKADEIGVSQESISGNSNRWEAISRNEKMVLNEMGIKNTIETFVKQVACDVFYNHVNESYWANKLENKEFPTQFNFDNKTHHLSDINLKGVNYELKNYSSIDGVERLGIKLDPENFTFTLNLSTILDSYASKTKETIISESIQSTIGVLDNVKQFANHSDIINSSKTIEYLKNILKIGDYTSLIINENKLKNLLNTNDNLQQEIPPEESTDEYGDPQKLE